MLAPLILLINSERHWFFRHQVSDTIRSIESCKEPKPKRTPELKINNKKFDDPAQVANEFADSLARVFDDAHDPSFDDHFKQLV